MQPVKLAPFFQCIGYQAIFTVIGKFGKCENSIRLFSGIALAIDKSEIEINRRMPILRFK